MPKKWIKKKGRARREELTTLRKKEREREEGHLRLRMAKGPRRRDLEADV